jgi:hypothetical protein
MTETIRVEVPCRRDADDLVEFLAGFGLAGSVTNATEHCDLEVGYAVDPDTRLRREFEGALGTWLATLDRPLVPTAEPGYDYVLRPPGD